MPVSYLDSGRPCKNDSTKEEALEQAVGAGQVDASFLSVLGKSFVNQHIWLTSNNCPLWMPVNKAFAVILYLNNKFHLFT